MLGGGMRFWANSFFSFNIFFFRKRKAKDVNVIRDIDLLGMALMLQIKIKVISNTPPRDMAFNITAQQEMVIAHLDMPHKQHWIDTVLASSAGPVTYAVPASTTRQDGGVAAPRVTHATRDEEGRQMSGHSGAALQDLVIRRCRSYNGKTAGKNGENRNF